jgi:hypothetical protein
MIVLAGAALYGSSSGGSRPGRTRRHRVPRDQGDQWDTQADMFLGHLGGTSRNSVWRGSRIGRCGAEGSSARPDRPSRGRLGGPKVRGPRLGGAASPPSSPHGGTRIGLATASQRHVPMRSVRHMQADRDDDVASEAGLVRAPKAPACTPITASTIAQSSTWSVAGRHGDAQPPSTTPGSWTGSTALAGCRVRDDGLPGSASSRRRAHRRPGATTNKASHLAETTCRSRVGARGRWSRTQVRTSSACRRARHGARGDRANRGQEAADCSQPTDTSASRRRLDPFARGQPRLSL